MMAHQVFASRFLETADFIGAKLCRDAIWSGQRCNWFGVPVRQTNRSKVLEAQSICGSDLYSGTSGIAVFLARLFAATGDKIFRITAEGAVRQALSRLDHFPGEMRVDFYKGLTGVAFGLFEVGESCGIDKFNDMGLLIMEEVARDETAENVSVDTVRALTRMYERHKRDSLLHLAGYSEEMRRNAESSNVAPSIFELFQLTGEKRYQEAEELLLGDLNAKTEIHPDVAVSFCTAYLEAFKVLREDLYSTRARAMLDSIELQIKSRSDEDVDFTLARGLTGKGDLFLEAGGLLGDQSALRTAEQIGKWGIERYLKDDLPWPCGSATGWDVPSLMNGLAGIGYFYLRLHDRTHVPSFLFA